MPVIEVLVPGVPGPPGPGVTVVDESTELSAAATKLTFAGAGVTATEPVANEVLVTIPGGGGGGSGTTTPLDFGAVAGSAVIDQDDIDAHPEWIGYEDGTPYPVGTTWDTVATQEAIYACFASSSTPGDVVWNFTSGDINKKLFVPKGTYKIKGQGLLLRAQGVDIEFESRLSACWEWNGDPDVKMFKCESLAYGAIRNITLSSAVPTIGVPLWSLDGNGDDPGGLSTQQITIYDMVLLGNNVAEWGLAISLAGSGAQGDTILLVNPGVFSFVNDGITNHGSNALGIQLVNGDIQLCGRDGLGFHGGQFFVDGTSFQGSYGGLAFSPAFNQITRGGADLHGYGAPTTCASVIKNVRSESVVGVRNYNGDPPTVSNYTLSGVGVGDWFANYPFQLGHTITAGTRGRAFVCVDDSGTLEWRAMTGGTTSVLEDASAGYTPDEWIGKNLFYRFPTGFTQHIGILDNDGTTITLDGTVFAAPTSPKRYKISGYSSAVDPDFDTAPEGARTFAVSLGYGFTTEVGSFDVVTNTNTAAGINVGDYIVVPDASELGPSDEGYVAWGCPLVGKVMSKAGGTLTLNRAAKRAVDDVVGYYGEGFVDNDLTWIHVDFDAFSGCRSITNANFAGCAAYCGDMHGIAASTANWQKNDPDQAYLGQAFTYETWEEHRRVSKIGKDIATDATVDLLTVMRSTNIAISTPIQNVTWNTTFVPPAGSQEFSIFITTSGTSSRTITFGTGFKSTGTLATGTVSGKKFVITFRSDGTDWLEVSRTGAL